MGRFAEKVKCSPGRRPHLKRIKSPAVKFNIASMFIENQTSASHASPFKCKRRIGQKIKVNGRLPKARRLIDSMKENLTNEEDLCEYLPPIEEEKENDPPSEEVEANQLFSPVRFPQTSKAQGNDSKNAGKSLLLRESNQSKKSTLILNDENNEPKKTDLTSDTKVWNDTILDSKKGPTVLWIPEEGRSLCIDDDSYVPFTHIVRTIHLHDALEVCYAKRIIPKRLVNFSCLKARNLVKNHPCKNMKVLWFGAEVPSKEKDCHNWYGNVKLSLPARTISRWKHCFLVEMVTTRTHTATRILLTDNDYSDELTAYDKHRHGGPLYVKEGKYYTLKDCSRYQGKGENRHGHILEFMVEASVVDQTMILEKSHVCFVNHTAARNMNVAHVCHRHQRSFGICPTPFPAHESARQFLVALNEMGGASGYGPENLARSAERLFKTVIKENNEQFNASRIVCEYNNIIYDNPVVTIPGVIGSYNNHQNNYLENYYEFASLNDYEHVSGRMCVQDYYSYDEQFTQDYYSYELPNVKASFRYSHYR